MTPPNPTTRRTFLKRSIATGAALASGSTFGLAAGANDKPGVLSIGVRGRGGAVAAGAARFGRIVSVCDVDAECSAGFLARLKKGIQDQVPDTCTDYRKALERKDVDIVTIGTPDHWHAKMIIDALEAGKDVYVEKPMTLTIEEGRIVCEAVKKSGRVVQVGTQQRSEYDGIFLKAVAIAHAGWLGNISMLLNRPLRWDPDKQEFVRNDQANALRSRKHRAPYGLNS